MYFHKATVLACLLAVSSALALPASSDVTLAKRALTARPYSEIQISDGVAGKAAEEAQAMFPVDPATASAADLQIVKKASQLVGDAENLAFLPANDQSQAAQNGFIKNKIQKAQGANVANIDTRIAGEQKKLATNTNTDRQHAGEASKGVVFDEQV
ncbi:hypothetical protein GQ53DRAFT_764359 [Thozetella sp. PMI_491]|nr:hypothetical protein GQ53DRAFT_764359 [Thozetella sp. PMI_491]